MLSLDRQNAYREQLRAEQPGWQPATEVFAGLVRDHLRPESRLLDLGCGRGGLVEQLDHPAGQMAGVDPDLASLREHRLPAMPRALAGSGDLPFAASSFDVVTASWLLEHLPDPRATVSEVGRVLRPGGVFIFITPNADHPLAWVNRAAGRLGLWQGRLVSRLYGREADDTFSTRYRANTAAVLAALATAAGLSLAELRTISDPTYLAFSPAIFRGVRAVERRLPAARYIHLVGVMQK